MRTPLTLLAIVALAALSSLPALAVEGDELIPCKLLSVKANKDFPMGGTFKFLCKAPAGGAFALPHGTADPTTHSASLLIRDLGSNLFILPGNTLHEAGWKGLGTPAGSKGFVYRSKALESPCRVVKVTPKQVSGSCKAYFGLGTLPAVGDIGMNFAFIGNPGDRVVYCAQFGGTEVRNDEAALVRKNSPAPAECPPLPFL